MMAPDWMNAVVADFGRAAGAKDFALGAAGTAAFKFANGAALRFEYTREELVVSMTSRPVHDAAAVRRVLALANPMARYGIGLRTGIVPKTGAAVVAVRLPERDVTLPTLNAVFAALWRATEDIGGFS